MNEIKLRNLELKIFTEQDALDYCLLNNINPDDITGLILNWNKLTDIIRIKIFKNLKELNLLDNELTDISVLKDLNKLETLTLNDNNIFDISVLKDLNKLKELNIGDNQITDISTVKDLKNLEILNIVNLELESDQLQYIQSLKKLKYLYCYKGFKDINILKLLNKSMGIINK